jgi:CMP-N-acetylneuraminic acid synthetase
MSLLERAISSAMNSGLFEEICVSTDDVEIARVAQELGAQVPFLRPKDLASDESLGIDVIKHAINFYANEGRNFHSLTLLQPTSPFRDVAKLQLAHSIFDASTCPSLISVMDASKFHPSTMYQKIEETEGESSTIQCILRKGDFVAGSRRQNFDRKYWRNGSVYIVSPQLVITGNVLLAEPILSIEMDWIESINVDELEDLTLARKIAVALGI